ncbi:hypothetical protein VDGD_21504 [Verticillium dahliae]|nr:hypothetical protein VDGD_21504 [Verticillium dahliae]
MAVLGLGLGVRAIVVLMARRSLLLLVVAKDLSEDRRSGAEQTSCARALLLLLPLRLLVRGYLDASRLLNDARNGTGSTRDDGAGRLVGNLVFPRFGLAAELLVHLELAVATVAVTGVVNTGLVVLIVLHAITAQLAAVIVLALAAKALPPLLNGAKYDLSALADAVVALVTLSGVVENTINDAGQGLVDIDVLVINGRHDLGNNPTNHFRGGATSGLVQKL